MNDLPRSITARWARAAIRALASLFAALALAACGPGTGGTGTGPDHGVGPGSLAGWFNGAWSAGDAEAVFEDGRIRVRRAGVEAQFNGAWSPSNSEVNVPVAVDTGPAGASPIGARLSATALADGTLRIVVLDGDGSILLGPVELKRR